MNLGTETAIFGFDFFLCLSQHQFHNNTIRQRDIPEPIINERSAKITVTINVMPNNNFGD